MKNSQAEQTSFESIKARLKERATPFAVATVVRTVDSTSAIPGGKALLDANGSILEGWVGGGCARSAISRAAREVIASGHPQLVSVRPQELLDAEGVSPGEERDGIHYARNGCPSKGTLDIFVEPVLPKQYLVVCGASPVAQSLAHLAARFDYNVILCVQPKARIDMDDMDDMEQKISTHAGFDFAAQLARPAYVVVATQGQGDLPALKAALESDARYIAFVGSRKKFSALSGQLAMEKGIAKDLLAQVYSPAGLDLHAITPDEIALSILAQIICIRRSGETDRQAADA